jgi:hypothetical protein
MTRRGIGRRAAVPLLCVLLLGACATVPPGPGITALPGTGKSFEQFQTDDATCRQWAARETRATPAGAAASSAARSATLGTLLGAAAGAAFGAVTGHPAAGALVGAGGGLVTGSVFGAGAGQAAGIETQRRYDNAYTQCMYASGNQVPAGAPAPRGTVFAPPPPPLPMP